MTVDIGTDNQGAFSICPNTGLPTYTQPEWTDVDFDSNCLFSYSIIGDRILSIKSKGYSTHIAAEASIHFAKKIIDQFFRDQKEYFYIADFSCLTGISKNANKCYIHAIMNSTRLKAFIMCSPSPLMVLAVNLSKRFHNKKFNIVVEKNYPAAVTRAASMAGRGAGDDGAPSWLSGAPLYDTETVCPPSSGRHLSRWGNAALPILTAKKKRPDLLTRITTEEWHLDLEGYSVRFELINGNIIHKISKGALNVGHVMPVYEMQEQIINSCGLADQPHYILNDARTLDEASLKSRKEYSRLLSEWVDKYPGIRKIIVYGASRLQRAGLSISMYFKPFPIYFAGTFEEAVALTQKAKKLKPSIRCILFPKNKSHRETVKYYAREFTSFLSSINWEVEGSDKLIFEKSDDHPFKTIYDATALIKADVDELFRDREMVQVALKESDEVSRALLNATRDLALLIHSDTTIISANQPFATFVCEPPDTLPGKKLIDFFPRYALSKKWAHFTRVVNTAEPAWFETRLKHRHFQNTLYPVFNMEKKVDRLALYLRDITELKEAEAQIHGLTQELIKAQENERRRIARDLHDNVAQDLASLIIQSDSLFDNCGDMRDETRRRCRVFSSVLKKSIASIRDLAYDLSPPGLEQVGFAKTVGRHCLDFTDKKGIEIDLYTAGLERIHLDTDAKLNLFRILQESLNNIHKHAKATRITIRLLTSHPHLIMKIEDNGRGFDPKARMLAALQEKRMGLKSMEERVNLLGGKLTIRSRKGQGTRVVVKYPYTRNLSGKDQRACCQGMTGQA